jgi:predicted secreted protein
MATNQAIPTQGTTFSIGTAPGTLIGDVVSWTGPRFDRSDIDVTHLGSDAKEYLPGLKDAGEFSMDVNFNLHDAGQKLVWDALDSTTPLAVTVTLANDDTLAFDAQVKGFETAGNADDKVTGSITLRITGDVTETVAP